MLGGAKHVGGCTNEVGGVRTPPHPPRKSASASYGLPSHVPNQSLFDTKKGMMQTRSRPDRDFRNRTGPDRIGTPDPVDRTGPDRIPDQDIDFF